MKKRKILVVDTSVLLYDMESIHSFPGNDVVVPLIVLDELDRFKDKPGILGESARYVNRFLDLLRDLGRLDEKITIPQSDQTIRVELRAPKTDSLKDLDYTRGDNRIIATALYLKAENPNLVLKVITKDINLRVKCDALGLKAEDYFNDHLDLSVDENYSGWKDLDLTDDQIDDLYSGDFIMPEEIELFENQFILAKSANKSFVGLFQNKKFAPLTMAVNQVIKLRPRNKEQKFAIEALLNKNIPLVTLTGLAGSGKTFLTLMCALEGLTEGRYERVIVTRSIQPVGRDIGYLPGDLQEKMEPWLAPIADNIKIAFKDTTYFDLMISKGSIEVAPLSFIRGRTFNNSFIIVDEAQNATIHELKTIVTRVGIDSKIVLLGDTDQIDTPYIDKNSNGLSNVVEKFKQSTLQAHVHLERGQRSELASEASRIL